MLNPQTCNPNLIRIPLKSKRQLQYELEESNRYRVLRLHNDVNESINQVISNAKNCIQQCREEILSIVSFLGEEEYPKLREIRVKLTGYTPEEEKAMQDRQLRIQQKEQAELSLRRAEIRARYWQDEVERLENFKDIRVFDSGSIDYLHTANSEQVPGKYITEKIPIKYQPRNQLNSKGKRLLSKQEALELVGRLTRRVSGDTINQSRKLAQKTIPSKTQLTQWSQIFKKQVLQRNPDTISNTSSDTTANSDRLTPQIKWVSRPSEVKRMVSDSRNRVNRKRYNSMQQVRQFPI